MGKPGEKRGASSPPRSKYLTKSAKPRQEISRILKYLIFFVNFCIVICGITSLALGLYLYINDFRPVLEAVDFFLNPAVVLITVGVVMSTIAILGCMGSLRENIFMLKMFALSLFLCYILLVVLAFIVFILFYSDTSTGISIQSLLTAAVTHYHHNDNYRDLMDYLQEQLKCCGATTQGYKDWGGSAQFNCSAQNPLPEKCGVPYSCCKPRPKLPGAEEQGVEYPIPTVQCWRDAQHQSLTEVQERIWTEGCLRPLQNAFEGHAVIIGAVIGAIIIPVCLSVTFSNILAKQIERQRYLLHKEAKKEERRNRRARHRFRDPFARAFTPPRRRAQIDEHLYTTMDETTDDTLPIAPVFSESGDPPKELRATNLTNELILGKNRAESEGQPGVSGEPSGKGKIRKKSRGEAAKRVSREVLEEEIMAPIPELTRRSDKDRPMSIAVESRPKRSRLSVAEVPHGRKRTSRSKMRKSATEPEHLDRRVPRETRDDINLNPSGRPRADAMSHRYHSDLSVKPL